jgi:hypothetical protein
MGRSGRHDKFAIPSSPEGRPLSFARHAVFHALALVAVSSGGLTAGADDLALARTVAEIRQSSLSTTSGSEHPMPLAAHWNVGLYPDGFDPSFQLREIGLGHHLLPWFVLPRPDHQDAKVDASYYTSALQQCAALRLPISFISTQWDALVADSICGERGASGKASARDTVCGRTNVLSPYSSEAEWYKAGLTWGRLPILADLQKIYAEPPLVLFLSNNEQPKLTWRQLLGTSPPDDAAASAQAQTAIRRRVGDAWIERYRELQRGFREGLQSERWTRAARFVGYDAIGPSALGRWSGWMDYSLYTPERIDPWHLALDGSSLSYYVNDWDPSTDFQVWSPEIEAMNWMPMVAEALKDDGGFWLEMSVWDGQRPGSPSDKRMFYRVHGQRYDASRYEGMVQFGMWLLRPRVVREFRDHLATRLQFGAYFHAVMDAVDRVYAIPQLGEFWRSGRLVANAVEVHPYAEAIPPQMRTAARWFLLDAAENPRRPWKLATPISVFAIALELGRSPRREWLVYAFAPLGTVSSAAVRIPGGPPAVVAAGAAGCFTVVREGSARTAVIELGDTPSSPTSACRTPGTAS